MAGQTTGEAKKPIGKAIRAVDNADKKLRKKKRNNDGFSKYIYQVSLSMFVIIKY